MTSPADSSRPDVSDMKAVHQVLRDSLNHAPDLVAGVSAGDAERLALISNFYENLLSFLHAHHQTEEELVFPLLRERCPGDLGLVDRIANQHADVLELVGKAETSVGSWKAGTEGAQERCASDLSKLGDSLNHHLDEEELEVLPLCAQNLTVEEWGAQPGHGMALFAGDKIWLVIGLIRQRLTQAQRDEMLVNMPPPAVEMWTSFGEQAFNELIAQVGLPVG